MRVFMVLSKPSLVGKSDVRRWFPKRLATSHKGDNGRVLIIGGNQIYHGAPILAALGALHSGTDLVYLLVPSYNFEVTRAAAPDFIVASYPGNYFTSDAIPYVLPFLGRVDAVLIGPGMGGVGAGAHVGGGASSATVDAAVAPDISDDSETIRAVADLLPRFPVTTVLDSVAMLALKRITKFPLPQQVVITPHLRELEKLVDKPLSARANHDPTSLLEKKLRYCTHLARDLELTILLKGHEDLIISRTGETRANRTGNAGMTVGGSGDVLAGFTASLLARGVDPYHAAQSAAFLLGAAGDQLAKTHGHAFTASELARSLPYIISRICS